MHLTNLDWIIVAIFVAGLVLAALATNRYARTVSGFLAADRCAGRYLIAVSYGMAQLGVISLVWFWQQYYDVGFTSVWWGFMENPALIVIALSGWVVYRFRQTRALTMAQFFEIRYSRKFRVFAGLVAFIGGILNYGVFPSVAARFFIALCGLPPVVQVVGVEVGTFPLLMGVLLGTALFFVFIGGQVAVIVTDFIQGSFGQLVFLAVMIFLLVTYSWSDIGTALLSAPEGQSLVNPFDLGQEERFNAFYWVISVIVLFYGMLGWQGTSGYNAAAIDAHEAKMANILNGWRYRVLMLITLVLPICIRVVMTSPEHAAEAAEIEAIIASQPVLGGDPEVLASQLRTPAAASIMLPSGLLGLFAAALVGAFISTNDSYLHSWGSIFIQDVVLPFRKKPLGARAHLWLLRASILGVAIFAFIFSFNYTPNQYVAMFLALTGAIFVGGAGSAIIGGLYWRRGTTAGAWAAMVAGMMLAGFGVVVKQLPASIVSPHPVLTIESASIDGGQASLPLEPGVEVVEAAIPFDQPGVTGSWSGVLESGPDAVEAVASIVILGQNGETVATPTLRSDGSQMVVSLDGGRSAVLELEPAATGFQRTVLSLAWHVREKVTGQVLTFWSILISVTLYIVVSLVTCRKPFDLDRMLHRSERTDENSDRSNRWWERLGFDRRMTGWDRFITAITIAWPLFFTAVFAVGMIRHLLGPGLGLDPITDDSWLEAWRWWLMLALGTAVLVTAWFLIGGLRDLVRMFRLLKQVDSDARDDGRVVDHHNADEDPMGQGSGVWRMNDAHRRTRRIHDDWTVARTGGDPEQGIPPASLPAELTATVPGVIHHDLIAAGVIPHPDRGDGEQRQKWVGRSDWTWSRSMGDADLPAGVPGDSVVDLVFDSIDTVGRVCLGDEVLGEVSNQFHRHRFRIDRAGIEAGERLEVRLRSPLVELDRLVDLHGDRPVNADGDWGIYSYLRKASCSFGWDWGPQCPSLGIPAEVRIECWRDARIEAVRPLVTSCNERLAVLETHLDLAVDAVTGGPGSLRATVSLEAPDGRVFTEAVDVRAKDGVSAGVARLRIEDPQRWWPRGRGDQPLHRLRVELRRGEELLDVVTRRIGLRLAALETGSDSEGSRFEVVVNGETIFCQGANWIPEGLFPGTASADSVRARIVQAVDAGFNMLRVWGGGVYESDDFYDACDELGVMVWQDFMFACATYPEEDPYPASIEREAREQVGRLSSHPSIVIWCGGNENVLAWRNWGWKERMDPAQTWGRRYFTELLPAVVAELDPSRPFLPDSPWSGSVEADPNDPDHGDRHTWDLKVESVREMVPRFVSEFGHQGPPSRTTIEAALGPAVFASESPEAMAGFAGRQRGWGGDEQQYDRWLEEWFSPATDLDGRLWRMQLLQARATTFTYEWLRLNQPRCGGALVWQLNDAWTGHSWSLIDVAGRVKPAWWAARTACRPRLLAFSVGAEGLEVAIANGGRESWNPHVRVRRVDFTGREIVATELELNASGFGVDRTPIDSGMSMPEDASMEYLVAEADGERACWFYGKDAWISMPRTSIDLEVFEDSGGHRVDLHARDLVRDLYVDVARVDPNATVDLNLLTFLPGESASLRLEGLQEWPLERIRNRFRQGGLISAANDCIMSPR